MRRINGLTHHPGLFHHPTLFVFQLIVLFCGISVNVLAVSDSTDTTQSAETVITPENSVVLTSPEDQPTSETVDHELIVALPPDGSLPVIDPELHDSITTEEVFQIGDQSFARIETVPDASAQVNSSIAAQNFETQPNYVRRATLIPNDTRFSSQWYHNSSSVGDKAPTAWDSQTGSDAVVVAIIDSGVDLDHPDLIDNIWSNPGEIADNEIDDDNNGYIDDVHGYDFINTNGDPTPDPDGEDNDNFAGADTSVEHGTHVAGLIGAVGNNGLGIAGTSWDVSLMALQVLDDEGSGNDADIVEAIQYAVDNGADVINLSLGGYGQSTILEAGINYATEHGVVVVAAAGNDGVNINSNSFFPVCYRDVIGVGSSGATGLVSSFSNYGSDCVDLVAPGELIYSTLYTDDPTHDFTDDYGFLTGTSMATPLVSGAAALLLAEDSSLTMDDVHDLLVDTTTAMDASSDYGSGRLNSSAAVAQVPQAHYPSTPTISAYANSSHTVSLHAGTRQTNTELHFSWSAAVDKEGVAGYWVYFGTDPEADPTEVGTFQTDRVLTVTTPSGDKQKYYLRVASVDTDSHVSSTVASFTYVIDTKVPAPKRLTARLENGQVTVQWKQVSSRQRPEKYRVWRAVGKKHKQWKKVATLKSKKHTWTDTTVKSGTTYYYKVQVIDDLGNKAMTQAVKAR